MGNSIHKNIDVAVKSTFKEFKNNPFDYTQNEMEAQVRLYQTLKNNISGNIYTYRDEPKPKYEHVKSCRVRIEYEIKAGFIPDILIFKNGLKNTEKTNMNDVEAFVEVKIGWGCKKRNFTDEKFKKDINNIKEYPDKGYIVYYMGDNMEELNKKRLNGYFEIIKNYGIKLEHIYILFRDRIITGSDFNLFETCSDIDLNYNSF